MCVLPSCPASLYSRRLSSATRRGSPARAVAQARCSKKDSCTRRTVREDPAASKTKMNRRAFTLIELLMTLCVIATLMAVALPSMLAATRHAQAQTCQANQRTIAAAESAYFVAHGRRFTEHLADLKENGVVPHCPSGGTYRVRILYRWIF